MKVYLVVTELDETVTSKFDKGDLLQFQAGAWFVRSELPTASEVAKRLGFNDDSGKVIGVVVAVKFFSGYAHSDLAETLPGWVGG